MKKWYGLVILLIIMISLFTGCGVPQDKYDQVSANLTAAQTQVQGLQSDLSARDTELTAKATELESLQGDLAAREAELAVLQDDLSTKEAALDTSQNSLSAKDAELQSALNDIAEAGGLIDVFNAIFIPSINGELAAMTEAEGMAFSLMWLDKINDLDDPELTAKFEGIINSGGTVQSTVNFYIYILERIQTLLE